MNFMSARLTGRTGSWVTLLLWLLLPCSGKVTQISHKGFIKCYQKKELSFLEMLLAQSIAKFVGLLALIFIHRAIISTLLRLTLSFVCVCLTSVHECSC